MKKDYEGKIKLIEQISKDVFKMQITSNLDQACAGQFISILCPNNTFRRPFSIADFQNGILTILFKLKGDGTSYLKSLQINDSINFIAPLGNGFELYKEKKALLVGAGIGIAPMLFLKKELNKNNIKNYLISGFKTDDEVIKGSDETIIGGSVLDSLDKIIQEKSIDIIYSCGPLIVLKMICEIARKYNIISQIAMEKVMACSLGVCRGCVIKIKENEIVKNASVCKDGPVFDGGKVIWE